MEELAVFAGLCVVAAAGAVIYVRVAIAERRIVTTIEEATANLKAQVQGVGDRVAADVAELKRIIEEEGDASGRLAAAVASIEESSTALQAIDPVADFPAPEPGPGPEPGPEPDPGGGETPASRRR